MAIEMQRDDTLRAEVLARLNAPDTDPRTVAQLRYAVEVYSERNQQ